MADGTKGQPEGMTSETKTTARAKSVRALRRAYYTRIMDGARQRVVCRLNHLGVPEESLYAMDVPLSWLRTMGQSALPRGSARKAIP